MRRLIPGFAFVLCTASLFLACGGGTEPGPDPLVPSTATIQDGNGQDATVGTAVGNRPSVLVKDQNGDPLGGVEVTFAAPPGHGIVAGGVVSTNGSGIAAVGSWTMPVTVGTKSLTATVLGLSGAPLTFTATAVAGPTANIAIVQGDGQTGLMVSVLDTAPSVRVSDGYDNPVAGASVTFAVTAGGGTLVGATPVTAANGIATLTSWQLGTAGTNHMTASVTAAPVVSVSFTAYSYSSTPTTIAAFAGANQVVPVNTNAPVAPSVLVTDASAVPVEGVPVRFLVTAGAGSIAGALAVTDANGTAAVTAWKMGILPGTNSVSASVAGLAGSPVTISSAAYGGNQLAMVKVAGDNQSAPVGFPVPIAPAVRVLNGAGNPAPNIPVSFLLDTGGGMITEGHDTTDANGIASPGEWRLGPVVGHQTIHAEALDVLGSPMIFTATGTGITWNGVISDNWAVAGNWNTQAVPGATDTVFIPQTETSPRLYGPVTVGAILLSGDSLTVGGQVLTVSRDLRLSGGGKLKMTNPADQVIVGGDAVFNGGSESGFLTDGVLTVAGDLTQSSDSVTPFYPTGSHRTVLNGSTQQYVAVERLQHLDVSNGGGITAPGIFVAGRLNLTTPVTVEIVDLMTLNGRVSTIAGSTLSASRATVNSDSLFTIAGTFDVVSVTVVAGQFLPDLPYDALLVEKGSPSTLTLTAPLNVNTLEIYSGNLVLAGHRVIASIALTDGSMAFLTMTSDADTMEVTTRLAIDGGDGTGHFTGGLLIIHGQFGGGSSHGPRAFPASGTHRTRFGGGIPQLTGFSVAGFNDSHFHDLDLVNAGTELFGGAIAVTGTLIVHDPGVKITDASMMVRSVDVTGLQLNNTPLTVDGGTITSLSGVTLASFPGTAIQLTVRHPGAASPFILNGFTFSSTPTTGLYVDAVDTDGTAPQLSIQINSNLTNTQGTAFTRTSTGPGPVQAAVTWP